MTCRKQPTGIMMCSIDESLYATDEDVSETTDTEDEK